MNPNDECCKICIFLLITRTLIIVPGGYVGAALLVLQSSDGECSRHNSSVNRTGTDMKRKQWVKKWRWRSGVRPAPSCSVTGGSSCVQTPGRDDMAWCTAHSQWLVHLWLMKSPFVTHSVYRWHISVSISSSGEAALLGLFAQPRAAPSLFHSVYT